MNKYLPLNGYLQMVYTHIERSVDASTLYKTQDYFMGDGFESNDQVTEAYMVIKEEIIPQVF